MDDIIKYVDDVTGNIYYYDGKEMKKIGNTGKKRQTQIGDKPTSQAAKDQLAREEELRNKLIQKQHREDNEADETDEERESRIKEIQDMFDDEQALNDARDEAETIATRDRERRTYGDRDTNFIYSGGIDAFKIDLERVVNKEFKAEKLPKMNIPDMAYEGSGLFVPAKKFKERKGKKPVFNVYYDNSGSFREPQFRLADSAMSILQEYKDKGKLEYNVYYFANRIDETARENGERGDRSKTGGGNQAGKDILDHIKATNADNVIIMTDSDIDYCSDMHGAAPIRVPGAAWHLFLGRASKDVQSHIRGVKQTKSYMIDV